MKVYEVPEGTPRLLTNPTDDVTDNAVNANLSIVTHYYPSVGMKYFHDTKTGKKWIERSNGDNTPKVGVYGARDAGEFKAAAPSKQLSSAEQTRRTDEALRKAKEALARHRGTKQSSANSTTDAALKEAMARLNKQAGGMTLAGSWTPTNPALDSIRSDLERDGDPRTPEQFLRDLISANDRDAAAKFREVRKAREKLMRQASGAKD